VDALVPEASQGFLGGGNAMRDREDHVVYTANLTPDATGLGGWTEEDFRRTLKLGLRPDGRPLRSPMTARAELTDAELSAIWAYLRTVPPIVNAVPSPYPETVDSSDAGRVVFHKYGCHTCHGDDGAGAQDLRAAAADHPTDESSSPHQARSSRSRAWRCRPGKAPSSSRNTRHWRYSPPCRKRASRAWRPPRPTARDGSTSDRRAGDSRAGRVPQLPDPMR
jgi:mono/diheme cytochrome c family protein